MNPTKISWIKKWTVKGWLLWEKIILAFLHVEPIEEKTSFFKVRVRPYWGKPIFWEKGEEIRKGNLILELQLNNEWLFESGIHSSSVVQFAIQMIRMTEQSLPKVTKFIHEHPNKEEIKGIYGVSIIHRGVQRFGFTVMDLPKGWFSLFTNIYLRLILFMVHPAGKQRIKTKTNLLIPKLILISKKKFMQLYPL